MKPPATYKPDQGLVAQYAAKFQRDEEKLAAALITFGPLPLAGQDELLNALTVAFVDFKGRGANVQPVTEAKVLKQLLAVHKASERLLGLLGVSARKPLPTQWREFCRDAPAADFVSVLDQFVPGDKFAIGKMTRMRLSTPEAATRGIERRREKDRYTEGELASIRAQSTENLDRCNQAIAGLWWIHDRADAAVRLAGATQTKSKHGGDRRGPTQLGWLIRDAICVYASMRNKHPESGNKPACGGPMFRFVSAVAELFESDLTDAQIEDTWNDRLDWGSSLELF